MQSILTATTTKTMSFIEGSCFVRGPYNSVEEFAVKVRIPSKLTQFIRRETVTKLLRFVMMSEKKTLKQQITEKAEDIGKLHKNYGSVQFALYIYRKELYSLNAEYSDLTKAKMQLTDTLIMNTVRNVCAFPVEEVLNLSRVTQFKKKLRKKLIKMKKLESLGFDVPRPQRVMCM